jgi:hypothetical protein
MTRLARLANPHCPRSRQSARVGAGLRTASQDELLSTQTLHLGVSAALPIKPLALPVKRTRGWPSLEFLQMVKGRA